MTTFIKAMSNAIERTGTGIEKTGTGIERSGTGIEKTGTGIERSGTGIERSGTGLSRGLFVAMAIALSSATPLAFADDKPDPFAIPASVDVRGDAVSLTIGAPGCALQGTGWQTQGYVRIPLAVAFDNQATIMVNGSGSGDKVNGSGSGGKVNGSGSGEKVNGSGSGDKVNGSGSGEPTSVQAACMNLIETFAIESTDQALEGARSWTQVWGVAELAIDGAEKAAVLVYPGGTHSEADAIALSVDVRVN